MRIDTFSVCLPSGCNASCPFCVSRMTGKGTARMLLDVRRLGIACRLAARAGVTTALITGKGEPTLYRAQVHAVLKLIAPFFPLVELQTNGLVIADGEWSADDLGALAVEGLTAISVSVVSMDDLANRDLMYPDRGAIDLRLLLDKIRGADLLARLNCTVFSGGVDSVTSLRDFIDNARGYADHLTFRPVAMPHGLLKEHVVAAWVQAHRLPEGRLREMQQWIDTEGEFLMSLPGGGRVYDIGGQNVALATCLTPPEPGETIRQLIYMPDGTVRYDWFLKGARLL